MSHEQSNYEDRIIIDPTVLVGKPVVKGTRIPVALILNLLADGYTTEHVLEAYPDLTERDVRAALSYAEARVNREEIRLSSLPG